MTPDLGVLAQLAYDAGIDPIDFAEEQVTLQLGVYLAITIGREALEPLLGPVDVSVPAMARRILGALLDAGWQPPVWPIPEPEVPQ